jgi:hypothetical protein
MGPEQSPGVAAIVLRSWRDIAHALSPVGGVQAGQGESQWSLSTAQPSIHFPHFGASMGEHGPSMRSIWNLTMAGSMVAGEGAGWGMERALKDL